MEKIVVCLLFVTVCGGLASAVNLKDNVLSFVSSRARNENDTRHFADCHQVRHDGGYTESDTYSLHLNNSFMYKIHCEFTPDNSFNVIQRRIDGTETFIKTFYQYLSPFGHPQLNYWAGLHNIYHLTSILGNTVLTIHLQNWAGRNYVLRYNHFSLMDKTYFKLNIQGYQGPLTDDFSYNNGMPFATYDRPDPNNCAFNQHAGWWYNYCSYALLNGVYYAGGHYTPTGGYYNGIYWKDWMGYGYSLKFVSMSVSRS